MTDGQSPGVFARGIGADFDKLHPMMQKRFGVSVANGRACVGTGVMHEIRRSPWWARPFLLLGATRNILFPESGSEVPFRIDNYPYIDDFGRETVTFIRTMHVGPGRRRRFDATMIYSERRGCVVDYLGTHQHLPVDLDLSVTERGGLRLISGEQRFYEGPIAFRFPLLFSGRAHLTEHYDDERGSYVIDLAVRNRIVGLLFGYRGEFTCEFPDAAAMPVSLKPYREERRE
ncbi:DUF4166 domain-containing protein [Microbacterium horticulturae]|uniref:DUF4166 domain-containing protein n=1 Tax=Microbacterium horticulturae TaxID=3028316 RepID=A0ABY8BXB9_9MICO|nr:DUF4166 domain-containing protein [Microbacterium sp. KACC 23027]WEG08844.1 DUF4166 domain-containing protein [Microbacterium sp. KACC 23027]